MRRKACTTAVMRDCLQWALWLWLGFAAPLEPAHPAAPGAPVADAELLAAVRPFPRSALAAAESTARNRQLLDAYLESIHAWGEVLAAEFKPVPGHPTWGYYGLGGHTEDEVRPITYAVVVNGFLAEVPSQSQVLDEQRPVRREHGLAALRYLTQAHVTGGGRCLNGKTWGDQWQSAMWARAAGLGAWIIWDRLDPPLQLAVARMIEHEADRFLHQEPKNSEFGDTGAEENAWNAMLLSLACNMLSEHPRAGGWDEAAKRYMYNTLSVAADRHDSTPGDDARPVQSWVTSVNAHPDFTVENHRLVHVGYLKLTVEQLFVGASHYLLGGKSVPQACLHHVPDSWQVLRRCMSWDGAPIYFGGNDWKLVHTQCTDIVSHAYLSLLCHDGEAAHLEDVALDVLRRIQREQGGFYNVRRDLEYGGFAASGLIACYFGHALRGAGAEPVSPAEFNRNVSGVTYLKYAQAILHRTPTKFTSFAWGPKRMALALPENGSWVVWPHFASYLGLVAGKDSSSRNARLESVRHEERPDGFSVIGRLIRRPGELRQDFACVSPPGDWLIYIERWSAPPGAALPPRETGVVGVEYPLGRNVRELLTPQGTTRMTGTGGTRAVHPINADWLNMDNQVGYVVRRQGDRPNVMRYHDEAEGSGRVPILQEWLSLVGDAEGSPPLGQEWACVVTALNQTAEATARLAQTVSFEVTGDQGTCRIAGMQVRANFATQQITLETR